VSHSVRDLPWLAPPPGDIRERIRKLADEPNPGAAMQFLAALRLEPQQAANLGKQIARARREKRTLAPLSDFKLGVLASATFDLLAEQIPAAAARHGVAAELIPADYGQVMQAALDPNSAIARARPDAVLVAVDHHWLGLDHDLGDPASRLSAALAQLRAVVEGVRQTAKAPAILQTVPAPPQSLFGSLDRAQPGSLRALSDAFNLALAGLAQETGSYLLDAAALAERIGTDNWFDPVQHFAYKLPFAAECAPAYADLVGRMLGAVRGRQRKCLVLDLDNTLWGGVIGDDGMEGILVGQGSALGEAHLAIQHYAKSLRARGIILAVSSKNEDAVARQPFRDHPDMALSESDIAVFQANWLDKPSNLEAIARTLNIGLDALVLLDDNPAERAQVRAALPMVAVPELPSDPSWFAWYLSSAGYFEAVNFSPEDAARAGSYAADAARAEVQAASRDLGDYLASLEMRLACTPFDALGRARIAQLINKSNQFNLTTRRYTEAEIAALGSDVFTAQVRLSDRFGDLGMIGVLIARPVANKGEPAWDLDTWLMSCRVLGRRVEEAMLAHVAGAAKAKGVRTLIGRYLPTPKNPMVAEHYSKLGFTRTGKSGQGASYELDLAAYTPPPLPFL
jgi:FkbH-like protein